VTNVFAGTREGGVASVRRWTRRSPIGEGRYPYFQVECDDHGNAALYPSILVARMLEANLAIEVRGHTRRSGTRRHVR
jgi:hypothetical protein